MGTLGEKQNATQLVLPSSRNFAFLALSAAVELDDILHDKPSPAEALGELSEALRKITSVTGSATLTSLADPLSADLIGRALERHSSTPINTVSALVQRANEVASSLTTTTQGSPKGDIEDLRNFCIALSKVAGSFQQQERERARPQHPYRR
jgi:hypothetical protein